MKIHSRSDSSVLTMADLFCGAGGTSTGAISACERRGFRVDLTAVNHWKTATDSYLANYPSARVLCTGINDINPRELFRNRELDFLLGSPECTHHSNAAGGRPINEQSRATAHCIIRWAEAVQPRVIIVENIPEFRSWGPLDSHQRPIKSRKGEIFEAWVKMLEACGYRVEWKILRAADYGVPTTRRRMFVQAVLGRTPMVWPDPTHADPHAEDFIEGTLAAWRGMDTQIDWSIEGRDIFETDKPLCANTMRRIWAGMKEVGLKRIEGGGEGQPFIIEIDQTGSNGKCFRPVTQPLSSVVSKNRHILVKPFLIELRGTSKTQLEMTHDIEAPIGAITAGGRHHGLVRPFLIPQQSGGKPRPIDRPAPTISTAGAIAIVEPFLVQYNGTATTRNIRKPLGSITTKARYGLVRPTVYVEGEKFSLGANYRMLAVRELAGAQGFPEGYRLAGNQEDQIKQIGNAVPPGFAEALIGAHLDRRG